METLSIPQLAKDWHKNVASRHKGFAKRHGLKVSHPEIYIDMPNLVDLIRLIQANRDHIDYIYLNRHNLRVYIWVRDVAGLKVDINFSAPVD